MPPSVHCGVCGACDGCYISSVTQTSVPCVIYIKVAVLSYQFRKQCIWGCHYQSMLVLLSLFDYTKLSALWYDSLYQRVTAQNLWFELSQANKTFLYNFHTRCNVTSAMFSVNWISDYKSYNNMGLHVPHMGLHMFNWLIRVKVIERIREVALPSNSVFYYVYVPGTIELWFYHWYTVYSECEWSNSLWPVGRYSLQITTALSSLCRLIGRHWTF